MSNPQASPGLPPPAPSPDLYQQLEAWFFDWKGRLHDGAFSHPAGVAFLRGMKNICDMAAPPAPSGSPAPADLGVRAEALWEELGGDLCICQRPDVTHWCEKCQQRINLIEAALSRVESSAIPRPALEVLRDQWMDEALRCEPEVRRNIRQCAGDLDRVLGPERQPALGKASSTNAIDPVDGNTTE